MKELTIDAIDELQPYIDAAQYNEYNSNVMTMLMWNPLYPVTYELYDHYALVQWHNEDDYSWMMPLCDKQYRKEAFDTMMAYDKKHRHDFYVASIIEEFKEWSMKEYPDMFLYENNKDAQDYVYEAEKNRTLSGKKMQKRRNHYNAFIKEYEGRFQYKNFDEIEIEEILDCLMRWNDAREQAPSLSAERRGICFILEHKERLPLYGGGIYIDGRLEAFLIASKLSADTMEIHVEKANRDMRGLYVAILKHFLMDQGEDIIYINREDDMGLESLRTAKTNMHPCCKIIKYGMMMRDISITKAEDEDKEAIQSLWIESFKEETQTSTDFYFNHLYHKEDTYVIKIENEIVAMLQARPIKIMMNGKEEDVSFIVGVATKSSFQHNHFMRDLLNHVLEERKKIEPFTILQAYDWDLYKPFGFAVSHERWKYHFKKADDEEIVDFQISEDASELLDMYTAYTKDKNGYRIRTKQDYEMYYIPYANIENGSYVALYKDEQPLGYILVYANEQEALVSECIKVQDGFETALSAYLKQQYERSTVYCGLDIELNETKEVLPCMMIKYHDEITASDSMFINEVL